MAKQNISCTVFASNHLPSSKGLSAKASSLLDTKSTFKASPHTLKPLGTFVFLYLE